MPRILGPRDYLADQTFGDIVEQSERIKGSRFERAGAEAKRQGFAAASGGGDLAAAFQSKFEREERLADIKEVDAAFSSASEIADQFGTEGANQFLSKAFGESAGLQGLFSAPPNVDNHVPNGLTQVSGVLNRDIPDAEGNILKKGENARIFMRGGQLVSVAPVSPQEAAGRGSTGGVPKDLQALSGLLDEQNARIISTYAGNIGPDGEEMDPVAFLQQLASAGDQQAVADLRNLNANILSGQQLTRQAFQQGAPGALTPSTDPRNSPQLSPLTPVPPGATTFQSRLRQRLPGQTIPPGGPGEFAPEQAGLVSSPSQNALFNAAETDILAEAQRRGLR